jgi:alkylation response protein AidB-like acyl-CoA dehydrogenase
MDLSFNQEQTMLRDMIRRLCLDMTPLSVLREFEGTDPGFSRPFWQQLGELGLTGLNISAQYGGLEYGSLEAAIVAEEFGRVLAVSPYHSSAVLAASLLEAVGDDLQKEALLPRMAQGELIVSVASDEYGGGSERCGIHATVSFDSGSYFLSGTKHYVGFANSSDSMIVLAKLEHDPECIVGLLLDQDLLKDTTFNYLPNLSQEPLYKIGFDRLEIPKRNVLNQGHCIWSQWLSVQLVGIISLAGFAVGAAETVQSMSVEYAKYRVAFGRPIGGFQAIAHYLADVEVLIEGARTLVYQAAWARDQGLPFEHLAAMAKLQACDVFCRASAVAIQVHGGIGYTTEADPQLFFRKAKQIQQLSLTPDFLERKIAEFVFS